MLTTELNKTFFVLQGFAVAAAILTGSTWQWVQNNGGLKGNQYNQIVVVAAGSSLIQTVTCFINALMYPNNSMGFMIYILINWVIMTHSSVMLVSKKLAMTYLNPDQVYRRLLMINVVMMPISLFVCVYWASAYHIENEVFDKINRIMEPLQITLWGIIEFCLSGAFILQMWKFNWTSVERQGILVLIAVGICDCMSVLTNIFVGDLESTSLKGFVYCLRIRLEVGVLCQMVDFVKSKRTNSISYGSSTSTRPKTFRSSISRALFSRSCTSSHMNQSTDTHLSGNSHWFMPPATPQDTHTALGGSSKAFVTTATTTSTDHDHHNNSDHTPPPFEEGHQKDKEAPGAHVTFEDEAAQLTKEIKELRPKSDHEEVLPGTTPGDTLTIEEKAADDGQYWNA